MARFTVNVTHDPEHLEKLLNELDDKGKQIFWVLDSGDSEGFCFTVVSGEMDDF